MKTRNICFMVGLVLVKIKVYANFFHATPKKSLNPAAHCSNMSLQNIGSPIRKTMGDALEDSSLPDAVGSAENVHLPLKRNFEVFDPPDSLNMDAIYLQFRALRNGERSA